MKIEEYYKGISRKRSLPSFDNINSEFEIDSIEKGNFALRIAEKIVEKTEKFRKVLDEFLHADGSSIAVLMEIKGMDDHDKDNINSLYKELIFIERDFLLAELDDKEEGLLNFIENGLEKWKSIKPGLKEFILKAKNSWEDDSKADTKLGYLG